MIIITLPPITLATQNQAAAEELLSHLQGFAQVMQRSLPDMTGTYAAKRLVAVANPVAFDARLVTGAHIIDEAAYLDEIEAHADRQANSAVEAHRARHALVRGQLVDSDAAGHHGETSVRCATGVSAEEKAALAGVGCLDRNFSKTGKQLTHQANAVVQCMCESQVFA